ncbi:MAG: Gfo/Idh/MocA family oxidoreductase [Acidobacteria bacterium]|nr:Gfo/Idh/MocA family oxidoreductase [Acidobacteriota bacterium]
MSTGQFKSVVVGCGDIAKTHLRYLKEMGQVHVAGVCDIDTGRLISTAERFGIDEKDNDFEALLKRVRPDVVHVLTPPTVAVPLALTAFRHACHVLVEKPMASTPDDAKRLVAAADEAGVSLAVDHSRLLHPSIMKARSLLEQGALGDLVAVDIVQGFTRARPVEGKPVPWSYTYPWGTYDNLMPHCLYYARAFAGDCEGLAVRAASRGRIPDSAFDELLVDMHGSVAQARILLTLATAPERNTVTLRGTRATVTVDTNLVTVIVTRDSNLPSMVAKSVHVVDPGWQLFRAAVGNVVDYARGRIRSYPDIRNTLHAFYAALRGEGPLPATGEDGLAVVEMMTAIRSQAEELLAEPARQEAGVT